MIHINTGALRVSIIDPEMTPLSEHDVRVLREALDCEYHQAALHDQILREFGEIERLRRVREVEDGHIHILRGLHERYGLKPDTNRWRAHYPRFVTLPRACEAAVAAEMQRAEHYRRLRTGVAEVSIVAQLRTLERASRDAHLPALQAIARAAAHPSPRPASPLARTTTDRAPTR